jgi:hypothetical protein
MGKPFWWSTAASGSSLATVHIGQWAVTGPATAFVFYSTVMTRATPGP